MDRMKQVCVHACVCVRGGRKSIINQLQTKINTSVIREAQRVTTKIIPYQCVFSLEQFCLYFYIPMEKLNV